MAKLSDDLRRILSGLAHQDAGEYLAMRDKMKALGAGTQTRRKPFSPPRNVTTKPRRQRIALISDGRGERAPLDYAIDACSRQGAMIDLLVHGVVDPTSISALENRIRAADLDCHRIQLGMNPGDDIVDYIRSQPSLIFLVASSDDDVAKVLIVDVIPRRGRRVPVPLVLIEDRSFARSAKKSAA